MKWPRSFRAAKCKKTVAEQKSGVEFRGITRSYVKKQEMLRSDKTEKEESKGVGFLSRARAGGATRKDQSWRLARGTLF